MLDVATAIANARARDPSLHALITPCLDAALVRDAELAAVTTRGALHRVPYTLKDVWDVAGLPTTFGHRPFADRIATRSGAIHRALEAAGAVLIGKTNLSDLGVTPECASYAGVTCNPHDPLRTSGGSSGGAAAAVASGMSAFDWGSDFGGSIRLPAAWCGVVGLRLSTAAWPLPEDDRTRPLPGADGLLAMGPIARNLATCRRVIDAVAPRLSVGRRDFDVKGVLWVAPDRFAYGMLDGFERTLRDRLARLGLPIGPAPLPSPRAFDRAFTALIASRAPRILAALGDPTEPRSTWLRRARQLHPQSARVYAELSLLHLRHRDEASAWARVLELRRRAHPLFDAGLVLAMPTSGHSAPRLGTALSTRGAGAFVKIANLLDATDLSVPFGRFDDGMPRGLSLVGPPGSERALIELAQALTD
ncbi:MAG: amidase family protein [Sandaracinaceae bacterium]